MKFPTWQLAIPHKWGIPHRLRTNDLDKSFHIVPRKVLEWALMKKDIPDVLVRSVMSQYEGAKTKVKEDSELSEEFEVKVGMHQGSVLSPFLFAVVLDVVTEFVREGALSQLL